MTIGYGSTTNVTKGMMITEEYAEELLKQDLKRFEQAVGRIIKVSLTQNEYDAIVSFTFNVGASALEHSTFARRMNSGDNKVDCFKEEFPKWTRGGTDVLPGLVRRREAEVKLAVQGLFP